MVVIVIVMSFIFAILSYAGFKFWRKETSDLNKEIDLLNLTLQKRTKEIKAKNMLIKNLKEALCQNATTQRKKGKK